MPYPTITASTPELAAFPEELLERILSLCVIAPLIQTERPQWHQRSNSGTLVVRGRLAPLLVCRKFFRICTPLFYHTIHITSPAQLHRLLTSALRPNLYLAAYVRRLLFAGIWAEGGELLSMCNGNVKMLDITLDVTQLAPRVNPNRDVRDLDAEEFCVGLKDITKSLTHLVLRKSNNIYLTQPKPKYVLGEIAKAMRAWDNLVCHPISLLSFISYSLLIHRPIWQELADIAFRLSDDSGLGPLAANLHLPINPPRVNLPEGPITSLTHALITRPKLRTFCTLLPSLWNETILRVSSNPNLECIVLGDGAYRPREHTHARTTSLTGKNFDGGVAYDGGIVGTGLFLMQAKNHARLSDLIRAGTYVSHSISYSLYSLLFSMYSQSSRSIMRTRAHTMGNTCSPPSSPSTPHSRSPALPHVNYVRSQSAILTSSGSPSPSSNASSMVSASALSTSQKHRQRQGDSQTQTKLWNHHLHHHHPNTPKFDSANLNRVSYGSGLGASPPLSRSWVPQAVWTGMSLNTWPCAGVHLTDLDGQLSRYPFSPSSRPVIPYVPHFLTTSLLPLPPPIPPLLVLWSCLFLFMSYNVLLL